MLVTFYQGWALAYQTTIYNKIPSSNKKTCDNIGISNVKRMKSENYRDYIASKKRYFYGVRVQLLTTIQYNTNICSLLTELDIEAVYTLIYYLIELD